MQCTSSSLSLNCFQFHCFGARCGVKPEMFVCALSVWRAENFHCAARVGRTLSRKGVAEMRSRSFQTSEMTSPNLVMFYYFVYTSPPLRSRSVRAHVVTVAVGWEFALVFVRLICVLHRSVFVFAPLFACEFYDLHCFSLEPSFRSFAVARRSGSKVHRNQK